MPSEVITLTVPALTAFSAVTGSGITALGSRLGWPDGHIGVLHEAVETALRPMVGSGKTSSGTATLQITVDKDGPGVSAVGIEVAHDGKPLTKTERREVHDELVESVESVEVRPNGRSIAFVCRSKR